MMSSLYIGASGLKTHGEGLGVIGHNIANVSTIGYKQQSMQFDDIFYATGPSGGGWESQTGSKVALSQVGMGARPGAVRTLFAVEGPIESGSSVFDMAILGKGFFQVTDPDTSIQYYTRAGNFSLNKDRYLCDPNGYFLTGFDLINDTGPAPIQIDMSPCKPAATSAIALSMNLGMSGAREPLDKENPYFGLLRSWDAAASPPLNPSLYDYAQSITVYDAKGEKQELMLYTVQAPAAPGSSKVIEYVLARPPADPAAAAPGEGLLMAGTLTFAGGVQLFDIKGNPVLDYKLGPSNYNSAGYFVDMNREPILDSAFIESMKGYRQVVDMNGYPVLDSKGDQVFIEEGLLQDGQLVDINKNPLQGDPVGSNGGQLVDMSAFTPNAVSMDLNDWTAATLKNGLPQFEPSDEQFITLNLGIQASPDLQWDETLSAAEVGTDQRALPSMGEATSSVDATTAYGNTSSLNVLRQDGYAEGRLMDMDITAKGVLIGIYSNGQNLELYQIPLCRFTSEDGLRHEGNNLYSSSPDRTGPMTMGVPDTENYGSIMAKHIEGSNVELSREITLMIMMQRGFQMNSKSITTSDTMLQRAIELKRA